MKCARCGKNDTGWSKEERNLLCDECLGISRRDDGPAGRYDNDLLNIAVARYFCPKCRAVPGRLCTVGVGMWHKATWAHKARRALSYKATPEHALLIQQLFEKADTDSTQFDKAWITLQGVLAEGE